MPLYEYKCRQCGRLMERIEKVAGPHLKKCPHCGGPVESLISAPAIQFKGSGWYVTDYAGKSSSEGSKDAKPAGESTEAPGKEKEGATKDSSVKESKDKKAAKKK